MYALRHVAPENKTAHHNQLAGLTVRLEGDQCRCGSEFAVINADSELHCRSCGRRRGWLTKFRADWIKEVIGRFGRAEAITIRGPRL